MKTNGSDSQYFLCLERFNNACRLDAVRFAFANQQEGLWNAPLVTRVDPSFRIYAGRKNLRGDRT